MGLLEKVAKCIDVLLDDDGCEQPVTDVNYEKGTTFEKHIIGLFDKKYFATHDWTRDLSGKFGTIVVESDANPDIVMRYKPTDEKIAIEAKFRSSLYKGALQWTTSDKLRGYRAYASKTGIPTFIVIGLGGLPDAPHQMFCIPIKEAKYPGLYPSIYEKYEHHVSRNFFWSSGVLK